MKYKLIIDKNAEETVTAVVHAPSELTAQIENLVRSFDGADSILGHREDELRRLFFSEIECITVLERKVHEVDPAVCLIRYSKPFICQVFRVCQELFFPSCR